MLGLLVVPGLALATGVFLPGSASSPPNTATVDTTSASTTATSTQSSPARTPGRDRRPEHNFQADLVRACGPAGLELVSLEQAETISPLQQGALDALREICEEHDLVLPPKPPRPVAREIVIVEKVVAPPASTVPYQTGEYPTPGGTVTIQYRPGEVLLVSAVPLPGYELRIDHEGPEEVKVKFGTEMVEWEFRARWKEGELEVTTREKPMEATTTTAEPTTTVGEGG